MTYVTRDQVEATTLGDRVAVLRDGELQQLAPPMELYGAPAHRFVAECTGSPSTILVPGTLTSTADGPLCTGASLTVPLGCPVAAPDGDVVLGVRPEDVEVGPPRPRRRRIFR
jgi:ABC-type sugar transport system ATPase subunit